MRVVDRIRLGHWEIVIGGWPDAPARPDGKNWYRVLASSGPLPDRASALAWIRTELDSRFPDWRDLHGTWWFHETPPTGAEFPGEDLEFANYYGQVPGDTRRDWRSVFHVHIRGPQDLTDEASAALRTYTMAQIEEMVRTGKMPAKD